MESDNWRTDEPEVGQICRLVNLAYPGVWTKSAGEKGFFFHPEKYVRLSVDVWPWLPITTPEETRLRERVRELSQFMLNLADELDELLPSTVGKSVREFLAAEKQEGGVDERAYLVDLAGA